MQREAQELNTVKNTGTLNEQVITTAFNMGIISACSLPLGALTALFWKPGDRVAAALVAFGGGACWQP